MVLIIVYICVAYMSELKYSFCFMTFLWVGKGIRNSLPCQILFLMGEKSQYIGALFYVRVQCERVCGACMHAVCVCVSVYVTEQCVVHVCVLYSLPG